jgi:peptidoglycan/xylan/chitin deacetylase (PgdA/CDA1 family)
MPLTIVMYHFVRELPFTRYPAIKGLLASDFRGQLDYLARHYQFVTAERTLSAAGGGEPLPDNAVLLTFDDGYIDHYTTVFPLLDARGIQGCFFPPAKAVRENQVLDVNKIHFILASARNVEQLLKDVYACLNELRAEFSLASNEEYFAKLAVASRFDCREVIFIKRLLQRELGREARQIITSRLFAKYVTGDEAAFSRELYVSVEQLRCMRRHGMYIGSHGHDHYWLDTLSPAEQRREIELSLDFLNEIGAPTERWIMCYPFGAYNDSLLGLLRRYRCAAGLTTQVALADVTPASALTLPRLDTNDLPKSADAAICDWTRQVTCAPAAAPRPGI